MPENTYDFAKAFEEVRESSVGGAPFLIAYGFTFILVGILAIIIPLRIAALAAMFQGGVALPLAFWLERRMGQRRMSSNNPLNSLSVQLAISQMLGLPVWIVIYNLNPRLLPLVLAGFAGAHFIPYAWLHRTRIYMYLGAAVSVGSFILLLLLQDGLFSITMIFIGGVYWLAALLIYRATRSDAALQLEF